MASRAIAYVPQVAEPLVERVARAEILVRKLIWVYFFLLIFEGALRMWILPKLSNELLVVRDPVILMMYFVAMRANFFPWNKFVIVLTIMGLELLAVGLYLHPMHVLVPLYGFHAAFLHLPLIFLIPRVMNKEDVLKFGKWFLVLAIPMAIIMAIQYHVGPHSIWNRGADDQFSQITSANGKIRPGGTFSYNLGPAYFFPCVVAFLLYQYLEERTVPAVLIALASAATCLAVAVSGSRTDLASCAIVIAAGLVGGLLGGGRRVGGLAKFFIVLVVALGVISQLSVFRSGETTFSDRITAASGTEGGGKGFVTRAFGFVPQSLAAAGRASPIGRGLGMSTNAGSKILTDSRRFLLAEGEWPAMVLEMGPFLGFAYLILRVGLAMYLAWRAFTFGKAGRVLPLLMLGVVAYAIPTAVFGQPTELGFTVFVGGLCLAAMREPDQAQVFKPAV